MDIERALEKVEGAIKTSGFVDTLRDPFRVLVSTIISARTKDETTAEVSERLFRRVRGFEDLRKIPEEELAELLKPAGFYRTKARNLKRLAGLTDRVPDTIEELVKLPGVGRKTANLVVSVAFGKPAVCVDTHVHRIMNRWGAVRTKTPEDTEKALREIAPQELWSRINALLVPFGKEVCRPISPLCSSCPLREECPKIGVDRHR